MLAWDRIKFADPIEALAGTRADLMDGWTAWTTADGEILHELRQKARQPTGDRRR
jgi:hypothetical protein